MLGSQQPADQPLVDTDLCGRDAAMLDWVVPGRHSRILRGRRQPQKRHGLVNHEALPALPPPPVIQVRARNARLYRRQPAACGTPDAPPSSAR
jgi:hypothetical protein